MSGNQNHQNRKNSNKQTQTSRRDFLSSTGKVVAGSTLAGAILPGVYAGEDNTIRVALVGCGGRGGGAAKNALSSETGPTQLVAMADLFEDKMSASYTALSEELGGRVDVPEDRRFLGFDAYKKAIDCLRPGDVMIQATHSAFRPTHVGYAIEKGVHVFMEKSFAPDPGGTHEIARLAKVADEKNIKIACGLMCRHSSSRQAMIQKIRDGAVGDVLLIRAYRLSPGVKVEPFRRREPELPWQIRRPYGFLWVSSGKFIEWMIHQVDECCWIKDAWPVAAQGVGGRCPDSPDCSQNFHAYGIEYTFADGSKAMVQSRGIPDCDNNFETFLHGTKCAAQFSGDYHAPTGLLFKDQQTDKENVTWRPEEETRNPYQVEWDVLLQAIREDRPHNEGHRAAMTNFASLLGRAAVHTGKRITWEEITNSQFQFAPNVDFTMECEPPVTADAEGQYPAPVPGKWVEV